MFSNFYMSGVNAVSDREKGQVDRERSFSNEVSGFSVQGNQESNGRESDLAHGRGSEFHES